MVRTQIYLTEQERAAIGTLARESGKAQSEVIREAIDYWVARSNKARRKAILGRVAGLWKDRTDLPDFVALRPSWDRESNRAQVTLSQGR
jgi:hypothetical protein